MAAPLLELAEDVVRVQGVLPRVSAVGGDLSLRKGETETGMPVSRHVVSVRRYPQSREHHPSVFTSQPIQQAIP